MHPGVERKSRPEREIGRAIPETKHAASEIEVAVAAHGGDRLEGGVGWVQNPRLDRELRSQRQRVRRAGTRARPVERQGIGVAAAGRPRDVGQRDRVGVARGIQRDRATPLVEPVSGKQLRRRSSAEGGGMGPADRRRGGVSRWCRRRLRRRHEDEAKGGDPDEHTSHQADLHQASTAWAGAQGSHGRSATSGSAAWRRQGHGAIAGHVLPHERIGPKLVRRTVRHDHVRAVVDEAEGGAALGERGEIWVAVANGPDVVGSISSPAVPTGFTRPRRCITVPASLLEGAPVVR